MTALYFILLGVFVGLWGMFAGLLFAWALMALNWRRL